MSAKELHPIFPHGIKTLTLVDGGIGYLVDVPFFNTIERGRRVENFLFSQCRVKIEGIWYKANQAELKAIAVYLDESRNGDATRQFQAYLRHSALPVPIPTPAPVAMPMVA